MAIAKHLLDLDLDNNNLLNVVLDKLPAAPTSPKQGRLYYNTTSNTVLVWTGAIWLDLGDIYNHPSYTALNPTLSGANVLATFETNSEGHVIAATTRLLTLANLGYTGATDANNYLHPTFSGNDLGAALTGATVISDVNVNSEGHVTSFVTRELTAADVGAAVINDSVTNLVNTWSSTQIQSKLDAISSTIAGALVYKGGYNAGTNTPNLDATPTGINQGFTYTVTAAGDFYTENVQVGDMLIAETNNPTTSADWTVVNKNIPDIVDATTVDKGIIRLGTQTEVNAGVLTNVAVSPATLVAFYNAQVSASGYSADIGNATATTFDLAHGLNTKLVLVEIFDNTTGATVYADVLRTTVGNVRVVVKTAPSIAKYKVLIRKV